MDWIKTRSKQKMEIILHLLVGPLGLMVGVTDSA